MDILIINGPNINLLGIREPAIYGSETYQSLVEQVAAEARRLGVNAHFFQSNSEGALVDAIQGALGKMDALILNPAAYTHTSIALLDALKAVGLPAVEVHLTDPDTREAFRAVSYVRAGCIATIKGRGIPGYLDALRLLSAHLADAGQGGG